MPENHYIPRYYKLEDYCQPGKVLVIFGARQVGKTTLIKHYLSSTQFKYKLESGDNLSLQVKFSNADFKTLLEHVSGYELLVIDEAQKIPRIGECLKILVDQMPGLRIIVTGSSSFDLAGQVGEPLTGRKRTLTLFPIAQLELLSQFNLGELKERVGDYLVYGSYPEVVEAVTHAEKSEAITEIANSYLLRDILELEKIKSPKVLLDLLRLIAFQIGSEVSHSELARQLMIDTKTVARYLDLLEKSFVLYNLRGFSRNLRKEITKKSKYYFYDVGIRNALVANFNDLTLRNDVGHLWENFIVIERLKFQSYHRLNVNNYFWRTWDKKEIDLVEERDGSLFAYECKWGKQRVKVPKDWSETYPDSSFEVINQENYLEFVSEAKTF